MAIIGSISEKSVLGAISEKALAVTFGDTNLSIIPQIVSIAFDGPIIIDIIYSMDLDDESIPDYEDFEVIVNGVKSEVIGTGITGPHMYVYVLTVNPGDVCTISYTKKDKPIKSEEDGVEAYNFSEEPVVNNLA